MVSPARRRYMEETARKAAEESGAVDLGSLSLYQKLLHDLTNDKAILKNLSGISDKVMAKREMIPAYREWIDGVLAAGVAPAEDKITPTILIWMIDAGMLDEAMPLVKFAIDAGLESTDEYARSLPEIIIEQMAEQIAAGAEIMPENIQGLVYWVVDRKEDGLHKHNMPDQIRAKLLKAVGERHEEAGEQKAALDCYVQALKYNDKAGVKKRIDALEKALAS